MVVSVKTPTAFQPRVIASRIRPRRSSTSGLHTAGPGSVSTDAIPRMPAHRAAADPSPHGPRSRPTDLPGPSHSGTGRRSRQPAGREVRGSCRCRRGSRPPVGGVDGAARSGSQPGLWRAGGRCLPGVFRRSHGRCRCQERSSHRCGRSWPGGWCYWCRIRRRVIDPIAHHGDRAVLRAEAGDRLGLVMRQQPGAPAVEAALDCDGGRNTVAAARGARPASGRADGQRWQPVLDCLDADQAPFAKGTLVGSAPGRIECNLDRRLIEGTVALAVQTGGFGARALRALSHTHAAS